MSVDLHVGLTCEVFASQLRALVRCELMEVLGVLDVPDVEIVELERGRRLPVRTEHLCVGNCYVVSLSNVEAELLLTLLPSRGWQEFYAQWPAVSVSAGISVYASGGEPIRLALACCLAICLAELSGTSVTDDALVWSKYYDALPNELRRAMTSPSHFSDLHVAAVAFESRMNPFSP